MGIERSGKFLYKGSEDNNVHIGKNYVSSERNRDVKEEKGYRSEVENENNEEFDDIEEVLRTFDLDPKFGPCIGITRSERWHRASKLGLDPPSTILELLRATNSDNKDVSRNGGKYTHSLWENRI